MAPRNEATRRRALAIERLVWHAVATAALALMVLVLLCALSWLDRLAAAPAGRVDAGVGPRARLESVDPERADPIARVDRPSG